MTPKTRIPKAVRREVRFALECWRDYFVAIGNAEGATAARDVTAVLGLDPLPPASSARFDTAKYRGAELRAMLENRERYGPR